MKEEKEKFYVCKQIATKLIILEKKWKTNLYLQPLLYISFAFFLSGITYYMLILNIIYWYLTTVVVFYKILHIKLKHCGG